jgi:sulfur relay (sulfurtransferase) DsrF/TusC family protein
MAPCGDISWREGLPVLIRGGFVRGTWWRRAEVWRQPQERLRSLLSKAVENLAAAVEEGDLKASIEVLKAVGMYGEGTMNAIHEQDPEKLIRRQAEVQVDREGLPRNTLLAMAETLDNAAWRHRLAEVEAEIRTLYLNA